MRRRSAGGLATALLLWCSGLHALGLGEIEVQSHLNQPLVASIPLTATSAEQESLTIKVAGPDAFERAGLERTDYLNALTFEIQDGRVLLRGTQPAKEPFLGLLLDVRWAGGRLLREYTVLLDPPTIASAPRASAPAAAPRSTTPESAPARPASAPAPRAAAPTRAAPVAPAPVVRAAPTQAPAPTAARPPAPAPARTEGSTYGPVQAGETLWSIAYRLRPDPRGISMDQMQVALFQANPQAFEGGRITGLMKGAVLRVPPSTEIRSIDPEEARAIVNAGRYGSAAPRTSTPAIAEARRPAERPAAVPRPERPPDAATARAPSPEAATTPAPASEPASSSTGAEAPAETFEDEELGDLALEAEPGAMTDEVPLEEEAPPPEATGPTAVPAPAPAPLEAPRPAPSLQDDPVGFALGLLEEFKQSPLFLQFEAFRQSPHFLPVAGGLGGLLLLLLLLRGRRGGRPRKPGAPPRTAKAVGTGAVAISSSGRSQKSLREQLEEDSRSVAAEAPEPVSRAAPAPPPSPAKRAPVPEPEEEDSLGPAIATAAAPAPARTAAPAATPTPDFDLTASFAADTVQINLDANDPIAEADFHLAYGLYDEAALLLKQAAQKNPSRTDIAIKLAETYFAAGKPGEFRAVAEGLQGRVNEADWQKIAIMGQQLCPDVAAFRDAGAGALGTDVDLAFDEPRAGEPVASRAAAPPAATPSTDSSVLDFKLEDLELPAMEAPSAGAGGGDKGNALEFDIGDLQVAAPVTATPAPEAPRKGDAASLGDFDLGSFDLEGDATPASAQEVAASGASAADLSLDVPELSLGPDSPELSLGTEPSPEDSLFGGDEAATKLDLARAYVDMGDNDMARSLLKEVLQQGNDEQKKEAQDLLGRLPA